MTPALKAMVEEMIAELRRQDALFCRDGEAPDPNAIMIGAGELIDLEKVARAGLEAISRPSLGSLAAAWKALGSDEECGIPVRDIYEAMIDAILGEKA